MLLGLSLLYHSQHPQSVICSIAAAIGHRLRCSAPLGGCVDIWLPWLSLTCAGPDVLPPVLAAACRKLWHWPLQKAKHSHLWTMPTCLALLATLLLVHMGACLHPAGNLKPLLKWQH